MLPSGENSTRGSVATCLVNDSHSSTFQKCVGTTDPRFPFIKFMSIGRIGKLDYNGVHKIRS